MSVYSDFKPPVFHVYDHADAQPQLERRSNDPINQLARAHHKVCLEASDAYEIAAHLEALGYNKGSVAAEYGVADHFELARMLFRQTPRRLSMRLPSKTVRASYARQAIMVLTLLVTAGIGLVSEVGAWGPVIWLLVWSQLGGALLNRAKGELATPDYNRVLSLLLKVGLVGMVMVWLITPFALATWAVSMLWLGVASLLWDGRVRAAFILPSVAGGLLALTLWLNLPITAMLLVCILATLVALRPLAVSSFPATWLWALSQWQHLAPFILYGLGQSALLLALLAGAGNEALPGVLLFAGVLLIAEPQLLWLRERLNRYLWKGQDAASYAFYARHAIIRYTSTYLIAFVPALIVLCYPTLFGSQWLFHLAGFALFGLVLALALVSLALGDSLMPALVFAIGGALVVLGAPFFWIAGTMALVEFTILFRRSGQLGSHGVFLL